MIERSKNFMYLAIGICAISLAILALILSFNQSGIFKNKSSSIAAINVDGSAFVMANPDIALIKMTIRFEDKKTSKASQIVREKAAKINEILTKKFAIKAKDIKTENYTTYPKYDYPQIICSSAHCPQSAPTLKGYEVSQEIAIKVRNFDELDNVIATLNNSNGNELNGFSFTIEDDKKFKEEARKMAINQAKDKAKKLADQLGVKLVRITAFSEQNYDQPRLYAAKTMAMNAMESSAPSSAAINPGENKVTSNVFITYEIE